MKRQKVIFKIVDYDVEEADNIESYEGIEEASENDLLSAEEQGFMVGFAGA